MHNVTMCVLKPRPPKTKPPARPTGGCCALVSHINVRSTEVILLRLPAAEHR